MVAILFLLEEHETHEKHLEEGKVCLGQVHGALPQERLGK